MKNIRKLLITEREKKEILSLHGKQMINEYTVKDIQNVLKYKLGYDIGSTGQKSDGVDGDFGSKTKNAIFSALTKTNVQQPVTQQPVTQQPVTQQPVTQQPVTQQPVTQQPVTQQQPIQKNEPVEKLPIRNVGLLQNPGANQQLKPGTPFIPTNTEEQPVNDKQPQEKPKDGYPTAKVYDESKYNMAKYVTASLNLFNELEKCLNSFEGIKDQTYDVSSKEIAGGNIYQLITQEQYKGTIQIGETQVPIWDIMNPKGSYFKNIYKLYNGYYLVANPYTAFGEEFTNESSLGSKDIPIFVCGQYKCFHETAKFNGNCEDLIQKINTMTGSSKPKPNTTITFGGK